MRISLEEVKRKLGANADSLIATAELFRKASSRRVYQVDAVKLGEAFRERREAAGISLRAMAKMIGVSAMMLSDVEHGKRSLSLYHTVLFLEKVKQL